MVQHDRMCSNTFGIFRPQDNLMTFQYMSEKDGELFKYLQCC